MMSMVLNPESSMWILMLLLFFSMNKYHIISTLIIAEFLAISTTFNFMKMLTLMSMEQYSLLYFIIVIISESVVGLSLLVSLMRTHSNDLMKSFTLIKF